jgi:hypothetical protein
MTERQKIMIGDLQHRLQMQQQEIERLRAENLELKAAWRSGEKPGDYPHLWEGGEQ